MARPSRLSPRILAIMAQPQRHAWTLVDLCTDLHAQRLKADFSSVFRAVETLVRAGLVHKIGLDPPRFELAGVHHDHLRCVSCDVLVPVPCLAIQLDMATLEGRTGFVLAHNDIVLEGICPACKGAA